MSVPDGWRVHVTIETTGGHRLEFTHDEIEELEFSTPYEITHVRHERFEAPEAKLGAAHFVMDARFREGRAPKWIETEAP